MFILSSELTDFYWRGTKLYFQPCPFNENLKWQGQHELIYDTILIIFAGLPLMKTWQSSAKVYFMHGILLDD